MATDVDVVVTVRDHFPDVLVGVEVVPGLVDIGQLDGVAEADRAAIGLLVADDHPEEGGLAGAVRTDDADDSGRRQLEGEVLDQQLVAEGLLQVLGVDHDVAEPGTGRNVDLDRVELDVLVLGQQFFVAGEAGLGLLATTLRVLPDPFEFGGDRLRAGGFLASLPGPGAACFCSSQEE